MAYAKLPEVPADKRFHAMNRKERRRLHLYGDRLVKQAGR